MSEGKFCTFIYFDFVQAEGRLQTLDRIRAETKQTGRQTDKQHRKTQPIEGSKVPAAQAQAQAQRRLYPISESFQETLRKFILSTYTTYLNLHTSTPDVSKIQRSSQSASQPSLSVADSIESWATSTGHRRSYDARLIRAPRSLDEPQ